MSLREVERLLEEIAVVDEQKLMAFQAHGLRVMYLSCKLARRLQVFDDDIRLASLLHDIGKVGIDSAILYKPGRLTPIEYQIIQAHCHIGNRMLRESLNRPRAAEFVRDHHERLDGRGYPRGLSGDQISPQAQIINVCDTFDTMTTERRSYQQDTASVAKALNEIRRCSGSQFIPRVATEFISMIKESPLEADTHEWYKEMGSIVPLRRRPTQLRGFQLD